MILKSGKLFYLYMGTICIPVYVGWTLLDEVVVNAQASLVKDTSYKGLRKVSFTLQDKNHALQKYPERDRINKILQRGD